MQNLDPFGRWGTFFALIAQAGIDAREFTAELIPHGYPITAQGAYLDQHAESLGLSRIPAARASGYVRMTVASDTRVPAGSVVQTPSGQGSDLRFIVSEDTVVTPSADRVPVLAEQTGTAYNVGPGRITTLVTLIPGVSAVTNDADWMTTRGVDRETDELLRERVLLRWPASGTGATYHAYILQAREVPGIVKVRVDDEHPRGQGTADVIIAPQRGAPSADQVEEAQELIEARRPVTANVLARAPDLQSVNIAVTLYVAAGDLTPEATWNAVVQAVIDDLGIGETLYPSQILDALHETGRIRGAQLTSSAAPIPALSASHLIISGQVNITTQEGS